MKKITQGKLEIFTSKANAINKLIQLQGVCKDIENSNNRPIEFYCNKNGKITVESLYSRHNPKKAQLSRYRGYHHTYTFLFEKSVEYKLKKHILTILNPYHIDNGYR